MRFATLSIAAVVVAVGSVLIVPRLTGERHDETATSIAPADTMSAGADPLFVPTTPTRRSVAAPAAELPGIPANAGNVVPLTLHVRTERRMNGQVHVARQVITRAFDRVHVAPREGPEWLFARNPVDARRVSGYLIDHASQSIVFHTDSDLRSMLGIPGWSHVLTLGVDPNEVAALHRSAGVRRISGFAFERFSGSNATGPDEAIWWNAEQLLAAEFSMSDSSGQTRYVVESLRATVDESRLREPGLRFPGYRTVDLADWLEQH